MSDFSELPDAYPDAQGPTLTGAAGRKCSRHVWAPDYVFTCPPSCADLAAHIAGTHQARTVYCERCGTIRDEVKARRGRQSRNYGNRAELSASRKYGGTKIGAAGGPVDIRGKDFATQVKTHRRLPPLEWSKSFAGMSQDNRCPRLLLRFVQPNVAPKDYFVFQADDFLAWFGRDGTDEEAR